VTTEYPEWIYFPKSSRPPDWVHAFVEVVEGARLDIESAHVDALTSDTVLGILRPGLESLGYQVESGKSRVQKIRRPVLFGDQGKENVAYEVDAVHDDLRVVVEIEAGRGARGNAMYRDLIRTSLIVDVDYLVLGMMSSYRHFSGGKPIAVASYEDSRKLLDAVYASGRLQLPFKGLLLFGY
jgi:hypothetical protein